MDDCVRYELLRPAQAVARRAACPLAYLPVVGIEWHGPQNPLGLDGLGVHGLCERAARKGGGLVFPVPWYGEHRELHLAEANPPVSAEVARAMGLPPGNFSRGYMGGGSVAEQANFYQKLLYHIYYQIRSLGFDAIYVLIGHGPLLEYVALTTKVFERATGVKMDFSTAADLVDGVELDHAGRTETGFMMALRPELVDLGELPDGASGQLIGIGGRDPRQGSAELGASFVPACVAGLVARAGKLLERPPSRGDLKIL